MASERTSLVALRVLVPFCVGAIAAGSLAAAGPVRLELHAGKYLRRDVPVHWELPAALAGETRFLLVRTDGPENDPVVSQYVPGDAPALAWIARGEMKPGTSRSYVLHHGKSGRASNPVLCVDDGASLRFTYSSRPVIEYNYAVVEPPTGYAPEYARSGYIHPVWNPSGRVITNDFPPHHKHHHGIWFPWTNTTFQGRKVDFWNSGKKQGKVEFVGMESSGGGPVFGHFRARHRFIDLTSPGGPTPVLNETWEVRVWALGDRFLFDLESRQSCAGESPLLLHKYRYGGLGFRGSHEWEGVGDKCRFLTSEGKTRADGHATRARWCDVYGTVEGRLTGVTVLCHPDNFRFPQHMRIHPSEPFFNFAPCQGGDFEIRPGETYVSRYRFHAHDGGADAETSERLWRDYAEPPEVRVKE